jgi:hypothetical protein
VVFQKILPERAHTDIICDVECERKCQPPPQDLLSSWHLLLPPTTHRVGLVDINTVLPAAERTTTRSAVERSEVHTLHLHTKRSLSFDSYHVDASCPSLGGYSSTTVAAPSVSALPSISNLTSFAAGVFLMVPVIAFAPANDFDDLDVNSHCQRKCVEGAC